MLHTDLLRLINSRQAWALVGSGPSIDAGCASWDTLLDNAMHDAGDRAVTALAADPIFKRARSKGDLPAAFHVVELATSRESLESSIRRSLTPCTQPGSLHRTLAELPFAGYITTNYDGLLEKALNALEPGWAPVGNLEDEVRKATGTAERVVWHIHGALELDDAASRLVVTQEDYDRLYADESRAFHQLRALLAHRRVVVIGFGFRDPYVMQMLKKVGRLTDAARPIYAIVERTRALQHTIDRQVFLRQYKVDVQPYRNEDGRHQGLHHTLSIYSAMSLRRSLRFGQHLVAAPTYDPQTTGLLIYNDLVLDRPITVPSDLRASILESRILSLCASTELTRAHLAEDLEHLLGRIVRRIDPGAASEQVDSALDIALESLVGRGHLTQAGDGFVLTEAGRETVLDHAAVSSRLEDQFRRSIQTRVETYGAPLGIALDRPAAVVEAFFKEAIDRRALGVALAFATGGLPSHAEYHALALLQTIGSWLDKADDEAQALTVVQTIQDVFREPSDAESTYIGTAVQARFVLHLLSLDNDALSVRLDEFRESLFIIDASALIPLLAVGSVGHDAAVVLINRLVESEGGVATTVQLLEEVVEHARWIQRTVRESGGVQSVPVFEVATGRAGSRTNAFLDGYLNVYGRDPAPISFDQYLARCFGVDSVAVPLDAGDVGTALATRGIQTMSFDSLASNEPDLRRDRDDYTREIRERRLQSATYKHDRQVRAEAEAVVLVEHARRGSLRLGDKAPTNAYFVSPTTLLNQVSRSGLPITVKPEAALSWLATLKAAPSEDLRLLMSELLWELQERRMNLIDQSTLLTAFGPMLTATKERLDEELPRYRALVAMRYGSEDPSDGPSPEAPVPVLDSPVVLDALMFERIEVLERELKGATAALEVAQQEVKASEVDAELLAKMEAAQAGRRKYQRRMANRKRRRKGG